jgi:hypothetical protein
LGRLVELGRRASPAPRAFVKPSGAGRFRGTDDLSGDLDSGPLRSSGYSKDSDRRRYGGRRRSGFYQVWKLLEKLFD